jgi:hypothetical protein
MFASGSQPLGKSSCHHQMVIDNAEGKTERERSHDGGEDRLSATENRV